MSAASNSINEKIQSQTAVEITKETLQELQGNVEHLKNKVSDLTSDAAQTGIDYIKEKPLHSVIIAGVVGFTAGVLISKK